MLYSDPAFPTRLTPPFDDLPTSLGACRGVELVGKYEPRKNEMKKTINEKEEKRGENLRHAPPFSERALRWDLENLSKIRCRQLWDGLTHKVIQGPEGKVRAKKAKKAKAKAKARGKEKVKGEGEGEGRRRGQR